MEENLNKELNKIQGEIKIIDQKKEKLKKEMENMS